MADDGGSRRPNLTGAGIAIGAGVGTALFVVTDGAVWIGVGVALGAAIGSAVDRRRQ